MSTSMRRVHSISCCRASSLVIRVSNVQHRARRLVLLVVGVSSRRKGGKIKQAPHRIGSERALTFLVSATSYIHLERPK